MLALETSTALSGDRTNEPLLWRQMCPDRCKHGYGSSEQIPEACLKAKSPQAPEWLTSPSLYTSSTRQSDIFSTRSIFTKKVTLINSATTKIILIWCNLYKISDIFSLSYLKCFHGVCLAQIEFHAGDKVNWFVHSKHCWTCLFGILQIVIERKRTLLFWRLPDFQRIKLIYLCTPEGRCRDNNTFHKCTHVSGVEAKPAILLLTVAQYLISDRVAYLKSVHDWNHLSLILVCVHSKPPWVPPSLPGFPIVDIGYIRCTLHQEVILSEAAS